ncbi:MAG: polysaccharide deacetylase [Arthrobacter sp.]|nr:polysaccharide deacetylase [Arthrobacter sp.]
MTRTRSSLARGRTRLVTIGVAVAAMAAALLTPGVANAAVGNSAPSALVSFTFDDGMASSITQAAPTLKKYGLTGTNYVVTNCVGMTTVPNNCRADTDVPYMTWDQILQLQNTYGWEIGSHTVAHQCLVSAGGDCQPTKLTAAQVDAELANSKAALAARGINATAFAPPYGDYDMSAVARVAKYYTSMRGFADTGNNIWPLGDYLLRNVPVQEVTTPVATLKAKVDEAIANKTWAVFTFHDIRPNPSRNPDAYQYGTAELDQLAAYVKTKVAAGQIKNVNISKGLVTGTPNKMPNPTFNNGLGDGWRTDAPATITADAANNGSYPDFAKSVKLVSGATQGHLFSPQVAVSPGTNYLYKTYLNVAAITSGEVAFYVDEYNAAGTWVSGQYRKRENSRWVEALNFTYTPSSTNVAKASLQVIVAGTGIKAYLDNVQLLALGAGTTPPPPSNLVANGTFDAGIGSGWRTDATTAIVADNAGNGAPANPVNSVKLQGRTANGHLFSPQVNVTPGNYNISAYLNIKNRTAGEVGWYIDEYNANGNWISGQWKLASTALGVSNVNLAYSPSTTSVAKASLQVYVTANSGVLAYVDDLRWWRR